MRLRAVTSEESGNGIHPSEIDTRPWPTLMTVGEVARRLRVDDTTVRRWIKTGALTCVELPHPGKRRSYRVRADTLAHLLRVGVSRENT